MVLSNGCPNKGVSSRESGKQEAGDRSWEDKKETPVKSVSLATCVNFTGQGRSEIRKEKKRKEESASRIEVGGAFCLRLEALCLRPQTSNLTPP